MCLRPLHGGRLKGDLGNDDEIVACIVQTGEDMTASWYWDTAKIDCCRFFGGFQLLTFSYFSFECQQLIDGCKT